MSAGPIEVLPGGFTLQGVGGGLFEMTRCDAEGVSSGLISAGELQEIIDQFGPGLADT